MIQVAILEDLKDVAYFLKEIINEKDNFECTQVYHSAEDAITFLSKNPADVLIVDIGLPRASGIDAIKQLKVDCPNTQFCMFTVYEDDDKIFESLKAGAKGYILKKSSPAQIVRAIEELLSGGSPMSPSIARRIIDLYASLPKIPAPQKLPISKREFELLNFLAQGMLYKEIADCMQITLGTVKQHIHNIYGKLEVSNRTEAINKLKGY